VLPSNFGSNEDAVCYCPFCAESPLSDRKSVDGGGGVDEVGERLRDIWRQACELKDESESVRQAHVKHVADTRQLLHASFVRIKVRHVARRSPLARPLN